MHFALCVGHSRLEHGKIEGGAISTGKVSEHHFNSGVAQLLKGFLAELGHTAFIFDRYEGQGYPSATRWLGSQMKVHEPKFGAVIELHFNSSDDPQSHGHEYLHLDGSQNGIRLAQCLAVAHWESYPGSRARKIHGVEGITSGGRGYLFLKNTPPPAVIAEPFFGSNPAEWLTYAGDPAKLARMYAAGLDAFAKKSA